jgi:hypothetical protein
MNKIISVTKIVFFVLISGFLFISTHIVHAQDFQIDLKADKTEIDKGEPLQLEVSVKTSDSQTIPQNVEIDGLEEFGQIGESMSTQVRIINGQASTVTVITKSVITTEPGKHTIGPAKIQLEDDHGEKIELTSEKITVNVKNISSGFRLTNTPIPNKNQPQITTPTDNFITLPPTNDDTENSTINNKKSNFLSSIINIIQTVLVIVLIFLVIRLIFFMIKRKNPMTNNPVKKIDNGSENNKYYQHKPNFISLPEDDDPEFYIKVKHKLLNKLDLQYNSDCSKLTTSEIAEKLKQDKIANQEQIVKILQICDTNIYSHLDEGKEEIKQLIDTL